MQSECAQGWRCAGSVEGESYSRNQLLIVTVRSPRFPAKGLLKVIHKLISRIHCGFEAPPTKAEWKGPPTKGVSSLSRKHVHAHDADRFLNRRSRLLTLVRAESSNERAIPLPGLASGRKWKTSAPHIRPNPTRGATNATSVAVAKLASTPNDRGLAIRPVSSHTCVLSARVTSRSKTLYAMSIDTKSPP